MAGYIKLHRGWRDNAIFHGKFSRADAWVWLIENAAWKPAKVRIKGKTVQIERSELSFSVRFMADAWGWSKSRAERFLADLRAESMIETRSKIGTSAGHLAGQGQSIITICNYARYQDREETERDNDDPKSGTKSGQQRDKEEEGKEGKKEEKKEGPAHPRGGAVDFAFFGKTVRLTPADFERWRRRYGAIPDLEAELGALDDWLQGQPEAKRAKWFHTVSGALNRKHQETLAARETPNPEYPAGHSGVPL